MRHRPNDFEALIERYLDGTTTAQENLKLEVRLRHDAKARQCLIEAIAVRSLLDLASGDPALSDQLSAAIEIPSGVPAGLGEVPPAPRTRVRPLPPLLVGAVLLGALITWSLWGRVVEVPREGWPTLPVERAILDVALESLEASPGDMSPVVWAMRETERAAPDFDQVLSRDGNIRKALHAIGMDGYSLPVVRQVIFMLGLLNEPRLTPIERVRVLPHLQKAVGNCLDPILWDLACRTEDPEVFRAVVSRITASRNPDVTRLLQDSDRLRVLLHRSTELGGMDGLLGALQHTEPRRELVPALFRVLGQRSVPLAEQNTLTQAALLIYQWGHDAMLGSTIRDELKAFAGGNGMTLGRLVAVRVLHLKEQHEPMWRDALVAFIGAEDAALREAVLGDFIRLGDSDRLTSLLDDPSPKIRHLADYGLKSLQWPDR